MRYVAVCTCLFSSARSVETFDQLRQAGAFDRPVMPKPDLVVDTSLHGPDAAAKLIAALLTGR